MFFKKIKDSTNLKVINKTLNNNYKTINREKLLSIGVLVNFDEFSDSEAIQKLITDLRLRAENTKVIWFSQQEELSLNSWEERFSPKDIGWRGKINKVTLQSFVDKNFDMLINYYAAPVIELQLITALSKASLKVGLNQSLSRFYDLTIATNPKDIEIFKKELINYLKSLNKI